MSRHSHLRENVGHPLPEFVHRSVMCTSPSGLHRMAYTEWGRSDNPRVIICAHGYTRTGRDFDYLAGALQAGYRVVCPDIVGRGRSEWLRDKMGYVLPQYVSDMVTLIARLDVEEVHWVGTSLGGMIGMILASQEENFISSIVLNDIGPLVTGDAIRRIGQYIGKAPDFATFAEVMDYSLPVTKAMGLGEHTEEQWHFLIEHLVHQRAEDGRWEFLYDRGLADPFRLARLFPSIDLWSVYDRIICPTLAIRGAESNILRRDDWLLMAERGPRASLVEIPGVGHAPTLLSEQQIGIVADFLAELETPQLFAAA